MRVLPILISCFLSLGLFAKENSFSSSRLKDFFDVFMCDEKAELANRGLSAPCPIAFWVSPDGSDTYPGTEVKPFRTLERARNAVRALSSSYFKYKPVYVYLKEGTYRLEQPLQLSGVDSGREGNYVIYSAAPGEYPVISGAIQVTGWVPYDVSLGIFRAYVGTHTSRQLYVNGVRATRAQTTANPAGFLPAWTDGGIKAVPTVLNPASWRDPLSWQHPESIEAVIITQWKMMRVPLQEIQSQTFPFPDPTTILITLQDPAWSNANIYLDSSTLLPGEWSFFEVTRFENALEFLTDPGEWYLDASDGWVYYMPRSGEDLTTADVEMPILETLIEGQGSLNDPLHHIRFEGITFSYATWLDPSGSNGYVSDQSGQLLQDYVHQTNIIGHDRFVEPTPGNLTFSYADNITFYGNIFQHLGAVGLHFGAGSRCNTIESNLFTDISSSAITLGAVRVSDAHPNVSNGILRNNVISNNLIRSVAKEYVDAAGIFVGFTNQTVIKNNTIVDVPWAGIAMGWGWGLLDVGSFPGLPHAYSGEWGTITSLTPNGNSEISRNKFYSFLTELWDGGAIYTTGQQGSSLSEGLIIKENVASGKRAAAGGNTYYTDGGSRYIQLKSNVSYDNTIGVTYYGPAPSILDPYFLMFPDYYLQNDLPYGSDSGGCVTYGDLSYTDNYWLENPIPTNIATYNAFYYSLLHFYPYSDFGFFDICPYSNNGVSYPVNLSYQNNHQISSKADIPTELLNNAGVQSRPPTIPASLWILPP